MIQSVFIICEKNHRERVSKYSFSLMLINLNIIKHLFSDWSVCITEMFCNIDKDISSFLESNN